MNGYQTCDVNGMDSCIYNLSDETSDWGGMCQAEVVVGDGFLDLENPCDITQIAVQACLVVYLGSAAKGLLDDVASKEHGA